MVLSRHFREDVQNDQWVQVKMVTITQSSGDLTQQCNEMPPHTHQDEWYENKQKIVHVGEAVEKTGSLDIVGENVENSDYSSKN